MKILLKKIGWVLAALSMVGIYLLVICCVVFDHWILLAKIVIYFLIGWFTGYFDIWGAIIWKLKRVLKYNDFD